MSEPAFCLMDDLGCVRALRRGHPWLGVAAIRPTLCSKYLTRGCMNCHRNAVPLILVASLLRSARPSYRSFGSSDRSNITIDDASTVLATMHSQDKFRGLGQWFAHGHPILARQTQMILCHISKSCKASRQKPCQTSVCAALDRLAKPCSGVSRQYYERPLRGGVSRLAEKNAIKEQFWRLSLSPLTYVPQPTLDTS